MCACSAAPPVSGIPTPGMTVQLRHTRQVDQMRSAGIRVIAALYLVLLIGFTYTSKFGYRINLKIVIR